MQRVTDVMTRNVQVISPQESIQAAARLMGELDVGALPVCSDRRLVGMITDRDITVKAAASDLRPSDVKVSEVMSTDPRWCMEDQTTDEVVQQMSDVQIRRIPVLNDQQEIVGIVALKDLALSEPSQAQDALEDISADQKDQTTH
ncbi:MAG: CBS domain-containing protein [Acidobacteriota bacterium]